jgi:hypothetical protein
LFGKPEVKRTLGRLSCSWQYTVTIGVREIERSVIDWINLALEQGPLLGSRKHGDEISASMNSWDIVEQVGDWRLPWRIQRIVRHGLGSEPQHKTTRHVPVNTVRSLVFHLGQEAEGFLHRWRVR